MPRFTDLDHDFVCPYRNGCPYLEGLPARWVLDRYQHSGGLECQYEHQLTELNGQLDQERRQFKQVELENQQLRAQLHALHRRQFKGRRTPAAPASNGAPTQSKKRGAPVGHPPWQRAKPKHIDRVVPVPAPKECPHCHSTDLQPVKELPEHVQEDIVLEPRTVATCYVHYQAPCRACDRNVLLPGPGELLGSYIGPAAKATEAYLRQELDVPYRKISRFFSDFFGLNFVPASAYGFERQAVRRALPLYEDLRQKIRALPLAHADETSWRHEGQNYWAWYAGNDDLAFFQFDPHRSTETAQSILGQEFAGILVSDAYAAYNGVHPKDWQSCLFHIKNKAKELDQELALLNGNAQDPQARQLCTQIQGWVRRACQTAHRLNQGSWRAKTAKKKERALRQDLRALCSHPLRYQRAETFRQRLLGPEQKHLLTCLRRPNVPPTNSQAERSMRPVVIMRRIIHCTRSLNGLENHSVLRSLFETARRQGRKPREFFIKLFTRNTAQAQATLYRKLPTGKPRPPPIRSRKP